LADRSRLSLNQITVKRLSASQAVEACVRHGIPSIALWRDKIADEGLANCVDAVRSAELHVSSVCRGGFFPAATDSERRIRIEDNFRAVDEAAALRADSLVMVVGGASPFGITEARRMINDGVAALVPYAQQAGVKIGLEPLHPMFAGDRSVLTSIEEALSIASHYPQRDVGVVLDTFHIWWHFDVKNQIARAGERILGFHVSDWLVPLPDTLLGRGMMGDGVIDLRGLREAVDSTGYNGPIEVEILNQTIWDTDPEQVIERVVQRFENLV
jgi:sugar phosphate isomerase/epimerase